MLATYMLRRMCVVARNMTSIYRYAYSRHNSSAWWKRKILTLRLNPVAIIRQKQINHFCKLSPVARLHSQTWERYSQEHVAIGHRSDITARLRALLLAEGCWFNPEWVSSFSSILTLLPISFEIFLMRYLKLTIFSGCIVPYKILRRYQTNSYLLLHRALRRVTLIIPTNALI